MRASITAILLFLSLSSVVQGFNSESSNSSGSKYDIQTITGMPLSKRALLGGVVISSMQVSLSAQISGDVLSVKGREGDMFEKGSVLVVLEQESIKAKKDAAYAEVASANEAVKNAQVQYEKSIVSPYANDMFGGAFSMFTDPMTRFTNRGDPNFNKYANRTSYYTGVQQAKNNLQRAKSNLKQTQEQLKDTNITAPFDGVVIAKNVNEGDIIQSGQILIKFANIKDLQVEVNIPSRLIRSLKLNKKYRIKLDIANTVVEADLAQIYPIADNSKHSVKVKFDLPAGIPVLPGAYAEVEIFESDSVALTPVVVQKAIMWRSSLPSVFVVNPDTNKTELRFIRLGEQVGSDKKSVLSGLRVGEKIIANPNILMVSGMSI